MSTKTIASVETYSATRFRNYFVAALVDRVQSALKNLKYTLAFVVFLDEEEPEQW